MPSFLFTLLHALLVAGPVHARHIHRPLRHLHNHAVHAQPATTTSSSTGPTISDDVQAIAIIDRALIAMQDDINIYFNSLEQRLDDLISLLSNATPATMQPHVSASKTTSSKLIPSAFPDPLSQFASWHPSPSHPATRMPDITTDVIRTPTITSELRLTIQEPMSTGYKTPPLSSPPIASSAPYVFDPDSRENVAAYYGQTVATHPGGLLMLCENANVDIIILAFVTTFFGPDGMPSVNFGNGGCYAPNDAQEASAAGLLSCPQLGAEIAACQAMGKPVLLSLGGAISTTSFTSDAQASQFASTLWKLFGAGATDKATAAPRPFGPDVIVDGFDIDNEDHDTSFYTTLATALRHQFSLDPSKTYYLSAAPQCPIPDESIPLGALLQADFVWTQFYNNPSCNLDSAGFVASFEAWSNQLFNAASTPRLYVGIPAFEAAGSGYTSGVQLDTYMDRIKALDVPNLGGVMLWDGSEAVANVDVAGLNFLQYAKASLG